MGGGGAEESCGEGMGENFSVCRTASRTGIKNESSARWLRDRALKCHWSGKGQL